MTILDLENPRANGAFAVLRRKTLSVRLSFDLRGAPRVKSISTIGRGHRILYLEPNLLAVEYLKQNEQDWKIVGLRVYGKIFYKNPPDLDEDGKEVWRPETGANVYNHDNIDSDIVPAWIRDAAISGMPK